MPRLCRAGLTLVYATHALSDTRIVELAVAEQRTLRAAADSALVTGAASEIGFLNGAGIVEPIVRAVDQKFTDRQRIMDVNLPGTFWSAGASAAIC